MDLTKQDIENYNKIHAQMCRDNGYIDVDLYDEYGVKRGLRDKRRTCRPYHNFRDNCI